MTARQGWRGARLAAGLVGIVVALTACGNGVQVVAGDDTAFVAGEVSSADDELLVETTSVAEMMEHGLVSVAVVHGLTPSEALAAVAPAPALPESPVEVVEEWELSTSHEDWTSTVTAVPTGDAVVLLELGGGVLGGMAVDPEGDDGLSVVVEALSRRREATVIWNVPDGGGWVVQHARVVELVREGSPWNSNTGTELPEEDGLDLTAENPELGAGMVELVGRVSGVELTVDGLMTGDDRTAIGVVVMAGAFPDIPQTLSPEEAAELHGECEGTEPVPVATETGADGTVTVYSGAYGPIC